MIDILGIFSKFSLDIPFVCVFLINLLCLLFFLIIIVKDESKKAVLEKFFIFCLGFSIIFAVLIKF